MVNEALVKMDKLYKDNAVLVAGQYRHVAWPDPPIVLRMQFAQEVVGN
jgi:hypothetical protein